MKLSNACVITVFMYGSETWQLTEKQEKKLDVFDQRCLRRVLKVRWQQHVTNETIRKRTRQEALCVKVGRLFNTHLRHLWSKTSSFFSCFSVSCQVSDPYIKTVITQALDSFIFTECLILRFRHTFAILDAITIILAMQWGKL